jgi:hypothetical protein
MDLSALDAEVIVARGQYATVNGEYKTAMSIMQQLTQSACDHLRHALQNDADRTMSLQDASKVIDMLVELDFKASELKVQKDELWQKAWGKK